MHTPSLPGRHFEEADRSHTAITVLQLLQGIHCERRSRPRLQGEFNGWPSWLGLESCICQSSMDGWEEQRVQGTAYHITQDVYRCKLEGILYGWQALRWPASQQSNCRIKVRSGPCKGSNQNVESLDNSPIMIWYATSYSGKPLQLPIVYNWRMPNTTLFSSISESPNPASFKHLSREGNAWTYPSTWLVQFLVFFSLISIFVELVTSHKDWSCFQLYANWGLIHQPRSPKSLAWGQAWVQQSSVNQNGLLEPCLSEATWSWQVVGSPCKQWGRDTLPVHMHMYERPFQTSWSPSVGCQLALERCLYRQICLGSLTLADFVVFSDSLDARDDGESHDNRKDSKLNLTT